MSYNDCNFEVATWIGSVKPSMLQDMVDRLDDPNMMSFALGLPDSELFPIAEYKKSINNLISSTSKVLQYAAPISSLKQHIVKLMATRKVKCTEAQVFLTNGAQQAISILTRLLLNHGGNIATESLTYPGILEIAAPFGAKIIGVPVHYQTGLCLSALEDVLSDARNKPAFFYTIPEGHNPLGISLNMEQKQKVAELSRHYKIPIIEDDAYGFLYHDSPTIPIRSYEEQWVLYVGTFSKILAPSFRVGWIIAPEELMPKLSYIKNGIDSNLATFSQSIVNEFLNNNILGGYLDTLRYNYKHKLNIMLKVIERYFPKDIKISAPQSGFFLWVELPKILNTTVILRKSLEANVAFIPSEAFSCNHKYTMFNGLRLNFSYCDPLMIERGIQILGEIIARELETNKKFNKL